MATDLEQFVNNVRTNSAAGEFFELLEICKQSTELLAKNTNYLDNVLETLDIQQHSMGVLFVLVAKFANTSGAAITEIEARLKLVREFVLLSNAKQVRIAAATFVELCHLYTSYLIKQHMASRGIRVLMQAIEKYRTCDSQLTAIHPDLCQLCLESMNMKPALCFLDVDITAIATTDDGNHDAKHFLLYYYYGGMVYTALKNYDRALYFFEVAISTPALSMSHIMLESYKKFILVSLILHGKVLPIPKYSSLGITRFMKPLSHAYHELSTSYKTGNCDEVRAVINKFRDTYQRDTNLGLVKQVAASLVKKNIQRLTKTFITLSLTDVASRVQLSGPAEAEEFILNMIKSGEIFASINQKDGMVVFKDDPEKYDTPETFLSVQNEMSRVMKLNSQIIKMEEDIMLNMFYVRKSVGNQEDDLINIGTSKINDLEPLE